MDSAWPWRAITKVWSMVMVHNLGPVARQRSLSLLSEWHSFSKPSDTCFSNGTSARGKKAGKRQRCEIVYLLRMEVNTELGDGSGKNRRPDRHLRYGSCSFRLPIGHGGRGTPQSTRIPRAVRVISSVAGQNVLMWISLSFTICAF